MKKLGLVLAGLMVVITLTACSRNVAMRDYLDEHEVILTEMFDMFGFGDLELSTTRDELIATFETSDAIYEQMESVIARIGAEDVGGVFESFIVEVHHAHMQTLANVIADEVDSEVTVRIIVNLAGNELVNLTFVSQ